MRGGAPPVCARRPAPNSAATSGMAGSTPPQVSLIRSAPPRRPPSRQRAPGVGDQLVG